MNDLKFAIRQLMKHKGSSLLAVLILALGIGGTTAVYSVAEKVLLNPIPGRDSERMVTVKEVAVNGQDTWPASPQMIQVLSDQANLFESLSYYRTTPTKAGLQHAGRSIELTGALVGSDFFKTIGAHPAVGRTFSAADTIHEVSKVVVLSHGLWQQVFQGDSTVVGQTVLINGVDRMVIGIMGQGVQFPHGPGHNQFWIPEAIPEGFVEENWSPDSYPWRMIGYLKDGEAAARLPVFLDTLAERWQFDVDERANRWRFEVEEAVWLGSRQLQDTLWSLLAMIGGLLLIACANTGNLLLSRAVYRQGEFAIRCALGAGRWRIVRQFLFESLILTGIAAGAGVLLAWHGVLTLDRFYLRDLPRFQAVGLDWKILGWICLLSLALGAVLGLLPAWFGLKANLNPILKANVSQHSGGLLRRTFHDGLIVLQVSVAVVLLVGAGLMVRSVAALLTVEPGINPKSLYEVSFDIGPLASREHIHNWQAWQEQLLEKLAATPGIQSVAGNSDIAAAGSRLRVGNGSDLIPASICPVGVGKWDYFQTVEAELVRGRWLTSDDAGVGEQAVIVNERMAQSAGPGSDPLEMQIYHGSDGSSFRVVGVIKDIQDRWKDIEIRPAVFLPFGRQGRDSPGQLVVRSPLAPETLRAAVVRAGAEMLPAVDLFFFHSIEANLNESTAPRRVMMWLLLLLGSLGTLLSSLGIYAVLMFSVGRRKREIGIRMALGAGPRQVSGLFILRGIRLVLVGALLGIVTASTAAYFLRSLLFRVEPFDPVAIIAVVIAILLAAGVACWMPASHAARTNPMDALRTD